MRLPKSAVLMTAALFASSSCADISKVTGVERTEAVDQARILEPNTGGFITTGGAEITLIVNGFTERWSFHAKGIDAKGHFNVVSRLFGQVVHIKGDIICYTIVGKRARVGGVVRWSSASGLVGTEAIWSAEDNGEGSGVFSADRVSPYQTAIDGLTARAYCSVPPIPSPEMLPIETGNVQVHE